MNLRRLTVLLVIVFLVLAALGVWYWYVLRSGEMVDLGDLIRGEPAEDRLVLRPAQFEDLPGWREDAVAEAVPAFLRSCKRISALPDEADLGEAFAGAAANWRPVCAAASKVPAGDQAAARAFFESELRPYAATNNEAPLGLFTGYYEPLLQGSRKRGGRYTIPLHIRPPELVMVDLGRFRDELEGQRVAGRVENGTLIPYPDRAEIEEGA
ncbi:MAG TPA: MltA domain-containing protein, partial [Thermoanaerobaculia bacterium]|nr:MltA domain-containing protein [Thermoanaerobaculia bacterium]